MIFLEIFVNTFYAIAGRIMLWSSVRHAATPEKRQEAIDAAMEDMGGYIPTLINWYIDKDYRWKFKFGAYFRWLYMLHKDLDDTVARIKEELFAGNGTHKENPFLKAATPKEAKKLYRELIKECHPDNGGTKEQMQTVTEMYEEYQAMLS